jgi:LysR family glycine cleavage system transcriptional activator
MKAYPDVAVTLTFIRNPEPFLNDAFDVGFWYGVGPLAGFCVDSLGANRVFPICRPSLIKGENGLRGIKDLVRCTLIDSSDEAYYNHRQPRQPGWFGWLQAAGVPELSGKQYLNFTPRILMHRAVVCGQGVGLSRTLLASDELSSRALAVPFGPALTETPTYNLVFPASLAKRKDIAAFRDWTLAEAQASSSKVEKILRKVSEK